jgi:hypothetical protein
LTSIPGRLLGALFLALGLRPLFLPEEIKLLGRHPFGVNFSRDHHAISQERLGDINNLREMARRLGSQGATADFKRMIGPYAEAAGINIEGLPDIQAFNSVIQKLAPQMHVAGSGATSDIEFKGMLSAIPQLSANPVAREAILDTMEAQQRHAMTQARLPPRSSTAT